jgi:hypothetical protein
MMTCQYFRANLQPGTTESGLLEHLRQCDACLDHAMDVDPDLFFRSLGGTELVPPGGVDAFVGDVMSQVRVRNAETALGPRYPNRVWQRLAIAATVAAGIAGSSLVYRFEAVAPVLPSVRVVAPVSKGVTPHPQIFATKSFVETYSSHDATIFEMPNDGNDAKIVMIFDEKLPADL